MLTAAIVASAIVFIDGTAVNVALPVLGRDLHAATASIQWVVESYALSLSALLLVGGAAGDRYGRRRIFALGSALFGVASVACGFAPNAAMLIAARFVQGIGAAFATPGSLALISSCFEGEDRGKAIGTWSGFTTVVSAIGPLLGGWLTQTVSWRAVFFLNVPLVVVVLGISALHVPESRDPDAKGPPDVAGALLAAFSLGALAFGLTRGQGTLDAYDVGAIAAGLMLLAAFVVRERTASNPMMPLALFANRTFAGANLYTLLVYAALGGSLFYIPFDLQSVQGYSPEAAGASLLPFIVIMFVLSRWSGGLISRIGARVPRVAGALIAAAGFAAFALAGLDRPYWVSFFPAACMLGFGAALFVAPLTTTVMSAVGDEHSGVASGINNAVSRVAGLIAIGAIGFVLLGIFYRDLDRSVDVAHLQPQTRAALAAGRAELPQLVVPPAAPARDRPAVRRVLRLSYTDGFRSAMLAGAALCVLASLIAWIVLRPRPREARNR